MSTRNKDTDMVGKVLPKTVLSKEKWMSKRAAAILAAFTFSVAGTGCDVEPSQDSAQQATTIELDEVVNLNDHKDAKLVQGREGCVEALKETGKTDTEAGDICDQMTKNAMAEMKSKNIASDGAPAPVTTTTTTTTAAAGSGGSNNALLWFLVGRSMSTPYYGSPSTGLTAFSSPSASYSSTAGAAPMTPPPAKITPMQADYLKAKGPDARAAVSSKYAAQGAKTSVVPAKNVSGSRGGLTSNGSSKASPGISRSAPSFSGGG